MNINNVRGLMKLTSNINDNGMIVMKWYYAIVAEKA